MRRHLTVVLAIALVVSACGGDSDGGDDSAAQEATSTTMAGKSDTGAMYMGDPMATPAEEVAGADVSMATFVLLETRPQGYDQTEGTAVLARHAAGTTVTIRLEGLIAGLEYISHVHEGVCSDNGGDHFKFDPKGSDMPPNEIHLVFTAAADGSGFMTAENDQTMGPDARSIVVHPLELLDNTLVCAEF